jgi:hypothetical protein
MHLPSIFVEIVFFIVVSIFEPTMINGSCTFWVKIALEYNTFSLSSVVFFSDSDDEDEDEAMFISFVVE